MSIPQDDGRRWDLVTDCGPFADLAGPIHMTRDHLEEHEAIRFGFRVAPKHCNPRPVCHGGMLATFLDVALARGIRMTHNLPAPMPTISMSLDYLAPALLGDWVDARVTVTRVGRGIGFAQAVVRGSSGPILRGSGVYKLPRPVAQGNRVSLGVTNW